MVDAKAFREGVGKLLAEVQRIKSEGDYPAAAKLFDTYGVHFDPKLRDDVVARVDKLNLPSYSGFVMPKLTPVMGTDGKPMGVSTRTISPRYFAAMGIPLLAGRLFLDSDDAGSPGVAIINDFHNYDGDPHIVAGR